MEVDFLSIVSFEETKVAGRIKPRDCRGGRTVVTLHLALRKAKLILQLPTSAFERIVERKIQVGVALVRRRRLLHIDFATIRQREPDVDFVKSAFAMSKTRPFQHNAARGHAAPELLESGNMLFDGALDLGRSGHPLKFNLGDVCMELST